jgi:hypothetical protein
MAIGAVNSATSMPPSAGPEISAMASTPALAVGLQQMFAAHEVGDEDVIGQLEQHGRDAGDGRDQIEERHRQQVPVRRRGNGQQRGGADEVAADEDRSPTMAIDPPAGEPCE